MLTLPDYLSARECRAVREAMDGGCPEAAEMLQDDIRLDEDVRRAAHVEVDEATLTAIEARLDGVRPQLEAFFGVRLGAREGASLLRYRTGGFFRRHRDRGHVASWPPAARRLISVVLFLSSSRDNTPAGRFSGGTLDLLDDHGTVVRRVTPAAGTLIAFRSDTLHEVQPVRDGVRETVVDWFYEAGATDGPSGSF